MGISKWYEKCTLAFNKLKKQLISSPILVSPDCKTSFKCQIDASQKAMGGTLAQMDSEGRERVVAYFGRRKLYSK